MAFVTPTDVTVGSVLTASKYNQEVVDNTASLYASVQRLGQQTRSTDYTANQSALASATDIFSSDITWTADGTSTYMIEFYCARVATGGAGAGAATQVTLVDGAGGEINVLALVQTPAASTMSAPVFVRVGYTPAAGSRSINARAVFVTSGNGVLYAATFGTGVPSPMRLSVYGPDIT